MEKEVQKKYPKAKPDKVIKLVANAYGNKTRESNYNMKRSSWSLIVLEAIHLKIGTTKRSTTNIEEERFESPLRSEVATTSNCSSTLPYPSDPSEIATPSRLSIAMNPSTTGRESH